MTNRPKTDEPPTMIERKPEDDRPDVESGVYEDGKEVGMWKRGANTHRRYHAPDPDEFEDGNLIPACQDQVAQFQGKTAAELKFVTYTLSMCETWRKPCAHCFPDQFREVAAEAADA